MGRIVGEREGEKMRQGLIMACAGCDAGAESGAYKVKRGETPIVERPESKEGTSRKDGECVEEESLDVRRVRGRLIDGG